MNYLLFLQNMRESLPAFVTYLFVVISESVIFVGPFIPLLIFICFDKKIGALIGFNCAATDFVINSIKLTACVYRPWIKDSRLYVAKEAASSATGYSFPSGHTGMAFSSYGSTAVWQRKRRWLCCLFIVLALLTALARNFLGAHTFLDVSCASLIALLVIIINKMLYGWFEKNEDKDYLILIITLAVCILLMLYFGLKSYPMDYDENGKLLVDGYKMATDGYASAGMLMAWAIGWFVERRYINFSIEGSRKAKLLRAVLAAVIFLIAYKVVFKYCFIMLPDHLYGFLRRFCSFFLMCPGYVFLIKKLQDKGIEI